jgi:plastocyanin
MSVRQAVHSSKRLLVFVSLAIAASWTAQGDGAAAAGRPADALVNGSRQVAAGRATVTGKAPAPTSVVILTPANGQVEWPTTRPPVLEQKSLMFWPGTLVVRTGQPVKFTNSDPDLHNINVKEYKTKEQSFNVAIPTGQAYSYTFERDGFYNVRCDIHASMFAAIVATSSPYAVVADSDGNFVLRDVPAGSYALTIYTGRDTITKPITVNSPRTEVAPAAGAGR